MITFTGEGEVYARDTSPLNDTEVCVIWHPFKNFIRERDPEG